MKYFVIFCLSAGILFAQNNGAMKRVQAFYQSVAGFEVQFEQVVGSSVVAAGKLTYKNKNKMRVEMNNLIIASDGQTTANYQKKQKKLILSNYDENDNSLLSFDKIVNQYPGQSTITESQENGNTVLLLKPKQQNTAFASLKCHVRKDNSIERIDLTDRVGHTMTFRFSNWKFFSPAESLFTIEPAKGVKVIDLR